MYPEALFHGNECGISNQELWLVNTSAISNLLYDGPRKYPQARGVHPRPADQMCDTVPYLGASDSRRQRSLPKGKLRKEEVSL